MQLITTDNLSEQDFRLLRRSGIGGSDAAAIAGVSPYKTAYQVYCEKRGEIDGDPENEAMHCGKLIEPVLVDEYQRLTGHKVVRSVFQKSPDFEWMFANLDGLVFNGDPTPHCILECKNVGHYSAAQWGEPGSNQIPEIYFTQIQHYLAVMGVDYADVMALLGGNKIGQYRVNRDNEFIEYLVKIEADFWRRVESGIPPDIDGSDAAKKVLSKRFPTDSGAKIEASEEIVTYVRALKEIRLQAKSVEEQEVLLTNKIKLFMADNSVLVTPEGELTWKSAKGSNKIDWEGLAKSLGASPELIAQYSSQTAGSRRFNVPRSWGKE